MTEIEIHSLSAPPVPIIASPLIDSIHYCETDRIKSFPFSLKYSKPDPNYPFDPSWIKSSEVYYFFSNKLYENVEKLRKEYPGIKSSDYKCKFDDSFHEEIGEYMIDRNPNSYDKGQSTYYQISRQDFIKNLRSAEYIYTKVEQLTCHDYRYKSKEPGPPVFLIYTKLICNIPENLDRIEISKRFLKTHDIDGNQVSGFSHNGQWTFNMGTNKIQNQENIYIEYNDKSEFPLFDPFLIRNFDHITKPFDELFYNKKYQINHRKLSFEGPPHPLPNILMEMTYEEIKKCNKGKGYESGILNKEYDRFIYSASQSFDRIYLDDYPKKINTLLVQNMLSIPWQLSYKDDIPTILPEYKESLETAKIDDGPNKDEIILRLQKELEESKKIISEAIERKNSYKSKYIETVEKLNKVLMQKY